MLECFIKKIKNTLQMKRYKTVVESWYLVNFVRALMGASVLTVNVSNGLDLEHRLSYLGFICFVFWYLLYFYCSLVTFMEDQTILRILYDTKLKQYADIFENVMTFLYVLYVMWKVPFDLSGFQSKAQELICIDRAIESMCESIDFSRSAFIAFISSLLQFVLSATKMFALWIILKNCDVVMPYCKMFQIVYAEMLVIMLASYYCIYLIIVKERYIIVNKLLWAVKEKNSTEYLIFVRERHVRNEQKALRIQNKYVCEKIKTCANIYSMLYRSTERANKKFGLALAFTMLRCLITDILHLFYLMEATASGLFHDIPRYIYFLIYVAWQILVATGVIYVMVWLCESTVAEAKATAFVIHQIINNNEGPAVTSEAMQFSLQILHQVPVFTARGLYKMDYLLVLEGARSVVTFLVMLIQFVTDPPTVL